ncbi:MAG: DNA cytosine methyltransferase [Euryarchaeota archaeon]|nr:DNA cytosine methyltransferase [Euryarchaeota archaeon]
MAKRKLKAISLFSGMGGLDLGLKAAGFKICAQVDNNPYCVETLKINWPTVPVIDNDISTISGKYILQKAGLKKNEVDLVAGGPSCQPFSRSNEGKRKGTKDARGLMVFEFERLVKGLRPKAFIMENVAGLVSSNGGKDLEKILWNYDRLDYHVFHRVLNAAEHGVPQKRKRLFFVGFREEVDFVFPEKTHGNGGKLKPVVTSGEVLRDLDDGVVYDAKTKIGGKYGYLINDIPPGMNYIYYTKEYDPKNALFKDRSKFWTFLLKLDPEQPSTTIQAQPWSSVGPFHWRNRRLTLNEIKRLQGTLDNYIVSGIRGNGNEYGSPAWMQIGNAVPPKLGEVVGRQVATHLLN